MVEADVRAPKTAIKNLAQAFNVQKIIMVFSAHVVVLGFGLRRPKKMTQIDLGTAGRLASLCS